MWLDAPFVRVNGTIDVSGAPAANAGDGAGGGSGGSVCILAESVLGNGRVVARGGAGAFSFGGGGGGGGRIAIHASEQLALPELNLDASGGAAGLDCAAGQVGTIWTRIGDERGTLLLGSCNGVGQGAAPALPEEGLEVDRLVVRGPVALDQDLLGGVPARSVEILCGATVPVESQLAVPADVSLRIDRGVVDVTEDAVLRVAELNPEVFSSGTLRVAGRVEVESGVVALGRSVTLEQVGRGVELFGAEGSPLRVLEVEPGATVTHTEGAGHEVYLAAAEEVSILGLIDVTGRGLAGATDATSSEAIAPEGSDALEVVEGARSLAGGSHGAAGGACGNDQCLRGESPSTATRPPRRFLGAEGALAPVAWLVQAGEWSASIPPCFDSTERSVRPVSQHRTDPVELAAAAAGRST